MYQKVTALVSVRLHGERGCDEVRLAFDQRGNHPVDGSVRHQRAPVAVLAPVQGRREVHLHSFNAMLSEGAKIARDKRRDLALELVQVTIAEKYG